MVVFLILMGCGQTGVDPDAPGSSSDLKFSVGDNLTLAPGESMTFSVTYKGQALDIGTCTSTYGVMSTTTTTCTYTAPALTADITAKSSASVAKGTESVTDGIDVSIANTSPQLSATLNVSIMVSVDDEEVVPEVAQCVTFDDCTGADAGKFCHFGTCTLLEDAGLELGDGGPGCENDDDCDEGKLCLPLDGVQGCGTYCADGSVFFSEDLGVPQDSEACGEEEGASWIEDDENCLPADSVACLDYDSGGGEDPIPGDDSLFAINSIHAFLGWGTSIGIDIWPLNFIDTAYCGTDIIRVEAQGFTDSATAIDGLQIGLGDAIAQIIPTSVELNSDYNNNDLFYVNGGDLLDAIESIGGTTGDTFWFKVLEIGVGASDYFDVEINYTEGFCDLVF